MLDGNASDRQYAFTPKVNTKEVIVSYKTILENAGINYGPNAEEGNGIDVTTGELVNMVKKGIVDPVLVTKKALINAVSVASTIISADCVISNIRDYASN